MPAAILVSISLRESGGLAWGLHTTVDLGHKPNYQANIVVWYAPCDYNGGLGLPVKRINRIVSDAPEINPVVYAVF
jgi:hypothetical protein